MPIDIKVNGETHSVDLEPSTPLLYVLRSSALRSLGAYGNVFAIESCIDEIARGVGADPFEFRLCHLEDERGRAVLEAVRELASSAPSRAGGAGRTGRGIAFAQCKNLSS